MADILDRAQALEESERESALRTARALSDERAAIPSATHCDECEDFIPEKRRALIPGVRLCVDCQGMEECRGRR